MDGSGRRWLPDFRVARSLAAILALAGSLASAPAAFAEPPTAPAVINPEAPPTVTPGADGTPGGESTPAAASAASPPGMAATDAAAMSAFLDRLMMAESGGRDEARNPRSTAVGPFQFIESTFLEVCRRHFAAETAGLTPPQILALRTNRAFARRAAEVFTRDNAAILANNGHPATAANLRLAYLVGPAAAVRLLSSAPEMPVISILGAAVVQANPFMAGMAAKDLAAWSHRNLAAGGGGPVLLAHATPAGATPEGSGATVPPLKATPPKPAVRCNLELASCRRHQALAEKRIQKAVTVASAAAAPRRGARVR